MNTLIFLFWLIEVVEKVGMLSAFGLTGSILSYIASYAYSTDDQGIQPPKAYSLRKKSSIVFFVAFAVWMITPSKNTMQMIVAAKATQYATEYISDTPVFKKSLKVIESKLDKMIESEKTVEIEPFLKF